MSCAVISVNRSLIVLAAIWGVMPVAALHMGAKPGTDDVSALNRAPPRSEPPSRQLQDEQGLLPSLYLAITQPDMKRAPVKAGQ